MPITISYSTAGCAGWVFSESLTVVGGFVHVVTRSTRDDDTHETEITEWRVTPPGGHPNCPTYGHPNCSTWPG